MTTIAFKLLRQRRDGTLGPLFINRKQVIPVGVWLRAECHPTPGYAVRAGWHTTSRPKAPHLSTTGRVWCRVEISNYREFQRPVTQGGLWWIAQRMRVIEVLQGRE